MVMIRRSRRNHFIILVVILSIVIYFTRQSIGEKWAVIKEVFKDDDFIEYKQINSNKDGSHIQNIDLKEIFKLDKEHSNIVFTPKYEKANATFYSIIKTNQVSDLLSSVQSIENRFNHQFHYDWVFVSYKRINTVSRKLLANSVSGNSLFYQVPQQEWGFPGKIDRNRAAKLRRKARLHKITTGILDILRFKARYQLGFFQDSEPMLRYKYYMRIDPGVEFKCDVKEDFFKAMTEEKKRYGFVGVRKEIMKLVETIWESAVEGFIKENEDLVSKDNLKSFFLNEDGSYNGCYLSNILEIIDLDFLRSEAYHKLFQYMDSLNGWFYERWTDSHIHSVASFLFLSKNDVKFFNINHRNDEYRMCSLYDAQYLSWNCFCNIEEDETFMSDANCMESLIELLPSDSNLQDLSKFKEFRQREKAFNDEDYNKMESINDDEDSLYNKGEDLRLLQKGASDEEMDKNGDDEENVDQGT